MRCLAERRLAQPGHALATHLGEGLRVSVHPLRHVMATDAGQRAAPLWHLRRGVVGTTGAEIGDAPKRRLQIGERAFLGLEEGESLLNALAGMEARDSLC